jgi:hypothetical protein
MSGWPNERSRVDAGTALCFHIGRHWFGATHRERYMMALLRSRSWK